MSKPEGKKKWYAIYTRSRWEKKVFGLLEGKGVECYCPLNKVRHKWSDRYKIVEEPLFKSYVFVRINLSEQQTVRFTEGVMNFVYWLGKPAVVRNKEIETIKKFLNRYSNVIVEPGELKIGQEIIIPSGIFMDKKGRIADIRNKRVVVWLADLGVNLVVDLNNTSSDSV